MTDTRIMTDTPFEPDYFEKFRTNFLVREKKGQTTWYSWQRITAQDGEKLIKAQLEQGTITRRPHAALIPDAPSTLALPEDERYEYANTDEIESTAHSERWKAAEGNVTNKMPWSGSAGSSDNVVPTQPEPGVEAAMQQQQQEQEKPPLSKEEQTQQMKVLVCTARKVHVHVVTNVVDFKTRLSKFDGNEYRPQPSNYYGTGVVLFALKQSLDQKHFARFPKFPYAVQRFPKFSKFPNLFQFGPNWKRDVVLNKTTRFQLGPTWKHLGTTLNNFEQYL